jgi:uracil-DNA glycosylase
LSSTIAAMSNLAAILALGHVAHDSVAAALGLKRSAVPFAHGASHAVRPGLAFFDSYHCSRYNTNTGVLTEEMFRSVFAALRARLSETA